MLRGPIVPLNRCMIQISQMEDSQLRKQLLLVIGVMVFMSVALTVEAGQRMVVPAVSRTSVYTKYADGGTGADGTALQVGEVAVHPIGYLAGCDPARPEIPYGTRITLDSLSSIGIRHGYTGQVQNYSVFTVSDIGDCKTSTTPGGQAPAYWIDVWVGRWKPMTGIPIGYTGPCGACDGFMDGTCVSSYYVNSCQVAETFGNATVQYHY